jgi:transcriptional regulator with XRE-family HTH domain
MDETQNLGIIVRHQRNRLGLTLAELAARSGVSPSHLSLIENAQRYPSLRILRLVAKPLNLDEKELFNLAGYLPADNSMAPDQEKHRLLEELDILVDRVAADTTRIRGIVQKLHKKP